MIVERNLRKTRTGKVVSNKMQKTIVVAVEDHVKHPLYNLVVQRMFYVLFDSDNNSFIHFVAGNFTSTCFSKISFHGLISFLKFRMGVY